METGYRKHLIKETNNIFNIIPESHADGFPLSSVCYAANKIATTTNKKPIIFVESDSNLL